MRRINFWCRRRRNLEVLTFGQYLPLNSTARHACLRLRKLRTTKKVPYVFCSRRRFFTCGRGHVARRKKVTRCAKYWRRVNTAKFFSLKHLVSSQYICTALFVSFEILQGFKSLNKNTRVARREMWQASLRVTSLCNLLCLLARSSLILVKSFQSLRQSWVNMVVSREPVKN